MRVPGLTRLQWVKQNFRGLQQPRAIILMYHRVGDLDADPWYLRVSPEHFDMQMRILRTRARPIHLHELPVALDQGRLADRSVVVSFDDGYANNLYQAKPILERYEIPATVFVTTGYLGARKEYWWDELEQALLRPGRLPSRLTLRDGEWTWDLGGAEVYSEEEYHHDCRHTREPSRRTQFYYAVWEKLRSVPHQHRTQLLTEIQSWAATEPSLRESHRSLTPQEVCTLADGGLVSIGAHTVTHALLTELPLEQQRHEIRESRSYLRELLKQEITTFSYPFGRYTDETAAIVRNEGYVAACSVTHSPVTIGMDCFQLPRFSVLDWNGEQFERQMLQWLAGSKQ